MNNVADAIEAPAGAPTDRQRSDVLHISVRKVGEPQWLELQQVGGRNAVNTKVQKAVLNVAIAGVSMWWASAKCLSALVAGRITGPTSTAILCLGA